MTRDFHSTHFRKIYNKSTVIFFSSKSKVPEVSRYADTKSDNGNSD